jgi:hypothetical protein
VVPGLPHGMARHEISGRNRSRMVDASWLRTTAMRGARTGPRPPGRAADQAMLSDGCPMWTNLGASRLPLRAAGRAPLHRRLDRYPSQSPGPCPLVKLVASTIIIGSGARAGVRAPGAQISAACRDVAHLSGAHPAAERPVTEFVWNRRRARNSGCR